MAVDVVMCGDQKVIMGMAVVGRSALEHTSQKLNFWIICNGFKEGDKIRLRDSWDHPNAGTVEFSDIENYKIQEFRSTAYLKSKMAYARYYVADFFPKLTRCVYLDTDLLVMRDLSEITKIDIGENKIAACPDISVRSGDSRKDFETRLGIKDYRKYFNSGVILIDLDYWRKADVTRKIVELSIDKSDALHSQDQDALNIIFEDKTFLLDTSWNTSQYEKPLPITGLIVHLIGTVKPWHAEYQKKFIEEYYENVIYRNFYNFLDRTPFGGKRPWNMWRLGELRELIWRKTPTIDMVAGKFKRYFDR